jgi:hypothetical protein
VISGPIWFDGAMRRLFPHWIAALLVVLLSALTLTAGSSSPAAAATCIGATTSVPDAVQAADAVVTATITKRITPAGGKGPVRYTAKVTGSFKGTATGSIPVMTQANSCRLASLTVGTTYLLFLRSRAHDWLAPAEMPSSDNVATLQPQVEAALAPPVVKFGEPQTGAPKSLRRVAAPGVALVIIGLLGLLFVRRSPRSHA